jgi:hypothetical protein
MNVRATSTVAILLSVAALSVSSSEAGESRCRIGAAKLEQTIAKKPELREGANAQTLRDLRTLQEAAIVLQSYKRESECEQVIAALKTLAADPERAIASGDTDEDKGEALDKVRAPKAASSGGAQTPERKPHLTGAKP